jgi:hypothetical protein
MTQVVRRADRGYMSMRSLDAAGPRILDEYVALNDAEDVDKPLRGGHAIRG